MRTLGMDSDTNYSYALDLSRPLAHTLSFTHTLTLIHAGWLPNANVHACALLARTLTQTARAKHTVVATAA